MACIKLRPCLRVILVAPILVLAATKFTAQTPEAKTKPTGSISGRVTVGEKPAPGIIVAASTQNGMPPMAQATSDADGSYRISGLAAGQIIVTPVAPVFVVPNSSMFGQGRVVTLSANDETVEGVDFKLTRAGVITGRITDADGRPVIEERISVVAVDENGGVIRGPTLRPTNPMMYQTDDRGVYRIYGLPAGHYKVSVGDEGRSTNLRAAGFYPRTFYPDGSDLAKAGIVDVSPGGETKNIDIKLGPRGSTYSISGRVIDAANGQPLPGISVSFSTVQQNQNQSYVTSTSGPSSPTNSQGEFRTEGLLPGRYVLMINPANFSVSTSPSPKFYSEPVPFEVQDGDVTNLEIKTKRALSISGFVVPDGITDKAVLARVPKLLVTSTLEQGPNELRTFSGGSVARINLDGSFSIEGLRPGKVTLDVGAYSGPELVGFSTTRVEYNGPVPNRQLELSSGQDLSGVKIYVAYGTGVIRGQVKVEGGTLPPGAEFRISVNRPGEAGRSYGQADSRGRFLIRGVSPGTYDVFLLLVSFGSAPLPNGFQRPQRQTVTVVEGTDTEVFFTLDLSRKDVP